MMPGATARRPSRPQRARGVARLQIRADRGGSQLQRLFQEGCAKIRFPTAALGDRDAVLINTAGGVTGGDCFDWTIEVGDNARCTALTQACEKAYRSDGDTARIGVKLTVGAGGRLDWLPQETILFDHARLERTFEINLADDARFLAVEAVILGRRAMGETVTQAHLLDRWRVRRDGELIFADAFRLASEAASLIGPTALLDGAGAYALVLLAGGEAETRLDAVRTALEAVKDAGRFGVSAFGGKLICRISAPDGVGLRRALLPVMAVLRDGAAPPRLWMV